VSRLRRAWCATETQNGCGGGQLGGATGSYPDTHVAGTDGETASGDETYLDRPVVLAVPTATYVKPGETETASGSYPEAGPCPCVWFSSRSGCAHDHDRYPGGDATLI
jgi:hypothetical protein